MSMITLRKKVLAERVATVVNDSKGMMVLSGPFWSYSSSWIWGLGNNFPQVDILKVDHHVSLPSSIIVTKLGNTAVGGT